MFNKPMKLQIKQLELQCQQDKISFNQSVSNSKIIIKEKITSVPFLTGSLVAGIAAGKVLQRKNKSFKIENMKAKRQRKLIPNLISIINSPLLLASLSYVIRKEQPENSK